MSKKWIRNWARRTVAGLVAGSLCMLTPGLALAEEKQEYNFDPILITAKRQESTDLKTAASVEVITSEKLRDTGATNALEALKFSSGMTIETYGARGSLSGGMTGGVSIRGMGKDLSALVLVNGIPINLNGKYELQNISTDSIERIEVIKGAASTLYGSSAMGGVINIITKKKGSNSISAEVGSFGTNRETLSLQAGNFYFYTDRSYTGSMGAMQVIKPGYTKVTTKNGKTTTSVYAPYYYNFDWESKQTYEFSWALTDAITWNYRHVDDSYQLTKAVGSTGGLAGKTWTEGSKLGSMWQRDANDISSLQIRTGSWLHKIYYNGLVRNQENSGPAASLSSNASKTSESRTEQYMQTYGVDSQSTWKTGFGDYTAGLSWQKDTYVSNVKIGSSQSVPMKQRDLLSFFGQVEHPLSAKTNMTLGLRQDFLLQQNDLENYAPVSPQFQLLHKLDKEQSLYLNVGKSFRAPNWSSMFLSTSGFVVANPSLAPDQGWTYEIGWKKIGKSDSLKLALYKLDFSNLHQWVSITDASNNKVYQSQNAEFRNFGLEIEYARSLKNGWGYTLGAMYGNPEAKEQNAEWIQSEAKFQLNSGITYKKGKWSGSLMATYVGDRQSLSKVQDSDPDPGAIPPSLQANLTLGYEVSKSTQLSFRVENLFNRIDYTNASGYITPERAYYVKLTQKF